MMIEESQNATYLGLDLSTQQLKAVVIDDNLNVLYETRVDFDNDLPEFRTCGGVLQSKEEVTVVTAPTLMWVKALDILLNRLKLGVDLGRITAISGSAQQHGTVYWSKGSAKILQNLNPEKFLHEQLIEAFSITPSPIWMDSSTGIECKLLEDAAEGKEKLAEITGSRGYERFSGPQIAKIARNRPKAYDDTERISLVSSFAASLFLGNYAPIDWADGSGMNLLDIRTKEWRDELLEACAPNLKVKLGQPVPSCTDIGSISNYFVERFGFSKKCRVVAFTGDNPGSLAGIKFEDQDIICSLGTSDVFILSLPEPKIAIEGHVFCDPVKYNAFMALVCSFKNGSLTRKRVCDKVADSDWKLFNELLDSTPRGNFGNFALYYDKMEIMPQIVGDYCFNKANERIIRYASKEIEVRALVEGQFLARRAHVENFGFVIGPKTRIIATGGVSANKSILQVLSDVFNSPVHALDIVNSSMLGGAYRAKYALLKDKFSFDHLRKALPEPQLICQPYYDAERIYMPMIKRYTKFLEEVALKDHQ